jgi:ubiquinone/menaquinone biosynthesis C-methylase UbiE
MIDYAQARLSTLEAIHWECADAALLPFPSGSFAAVACQFGMMFVKDKEAAFREARRVLADDGVLAFSVWDSLAHNPFSRIAHETVSSFFPENPPDFFRVAFGLHDRRALRRSLVAHGFEHVRLDTVTLEIRSPSAGSLAVGQVREVL